MINYFNTKNIFQNTIQINQRLISRKKKYRKNNFHISDVNKLNVINCNRKINMI